MVTREMLAAMDDFDLYDFMSGWTDPDTGEALDMEATALLDCELLRRGSPTDEELECGDRQGDFSGCASFIVEDWKHWDMPESVPELAIELRKAKARLAGEAALATGTKKPRTKKPKEPPPKYRTTGRWGHESEDGPW